MSYIARTGWLAATPELRDGEHGPYCFARVLVTDRIKEGDAWRDGAVTAYDLTVSGNQAVRLVSTAEACGNTEITFTGSLVTDVWGDNNDKLANKVRADTVAVALRTQTVTAIDK